MARLISLETAIFLWSFLNLCTGWLFRDMFEVCYDNPPIGCFSPLPPHNNAGGFRPQSPESIGVRFKHYISGEDSRDFDIHEASRVMSSRYNPSLKTVVIIHGYLESWRKPWISRMIRQIFIKELANIIVVDWYEGAGRLIYLQSAANARVVGAVVALLLEKLISLQAEPATFHLIGYSLGAHVAGYAGSRCRGIGRITALDPAGPAFTNADPQARLDPDDALYVDVIHTAGSGKSINLGTAQPMGTVDFYPNGGMDQPGCNGTVLSRISEFMSSWEGDIFACSHRRSRDLFISTINDNCQGYNMSLCQSVNDVLENSCTPCDLDQCSQMGYGHSYTRIPQTSQRTLLRFVTGDAWPFC